MQSPYLVYLGYLNMAVAAAFRTFAIKCVLVQYLSYTFPNEENFSPLSQKGRIHLFRMLKTCRQIISETRHILQPSH